MNIHFKLKSANAKTGPIPVSTSDNRTCPDACPLKAGGCYAASSFLGMFWRKVSAGAYGGPFKDFVGAVAKLPANTLWRHNQAGDLIPAQADASQIDVRSLQELTAANATAGAHGFTYTHYDPALGTNAAAIRGANQNGFTVNLSANNFDHADQLQNMNAGPVVTLAPVSYQRKHKRKNGVTNWLETMPEYKARLEKLGTKTPQNNVIVVCPATASDSISCATCKLCQKQRQSIVAFPAHGASKNKVSKIAEMAVQNA